VNTKANQAMYHFLFWSGPKEPRELKYKCEHTIKYHNQAMLDIKDTLLLIYY